MQRSFFSAEWGRRELGVGSWGLGKKGIGSWELGVGEEEDGGMGGWGDGGNFRLNTLLRLSTLLRRSKDLHN
uniref:Uncharacterized protein n=1 Tax=Desertifilum tharense IPPAS B-1220 TaxID=1781255 RepID=A0ACD5GVG1_9CYAN